MEQNMKYTKEPWSVDSKKSLRVVDSDDNTVCTVGCTDVLRDEWEDNARRIVACVNACAGWPTLFLEGIVTAGATLKQKSDEMALRAIDAEQQRDDLLEALQGLLNVLPSATTHPAIKAAREAIAKAEHPNDRT